jgi:hypothetical protein
VYPVHSTNGNPELEMQLIGSFYEVRVCQYDKRWSVISLKLTNRINKQPTNV